MAPMESNKTFSFNWLTTIQCRIVLTLNNQSSFKIDHNIEFVISASTFNLRTHISKMK